MVYGFCILLSIFIDLNVSAMGPEGNSYSCIANGYPDLQLVGWRTGMGSRTLIQPNTTSERFEFHSRVTSTLIVDREEQCRASRGYRCIFSKGGATPAVESSTIHCTPGNCMVISI